MGKMTCGRYAFLILVSLALVGVAAVAVVFFWLGHDPTTSNAPPLERALEATDPVALSLGESDSRPHMDPMDQEITPILGRALSEATMEITERAPVIFLDLDGAERVLRSLESRRFDARDRRYRFISELEMYIRKTNDPSERVRAQYLLAQAQKLASDLDSCEATLRDLVHSQEFSLLDGEQADRAAFTLLLIKYAKWVQYSHTKTRYQQPLREFRDTATWIAERGPGRCLLGFSIPTATESLIKTTNNQADSVDRFVATTCLYFDLLCCRFDPAGDDSSFRGDASRYRSELYALVSDPAFEPSVRRRFGSTSEMTPLCRYYAASVLYEARDFDKAMELVGDTVGEPSSNNPHYVKFAVLAAEIAYRQERYADAKRYMAQIRGTTSPDVGIRYNRDSIEMILKELERH